MSDKNFLCFWHRAESFLVGGQGFLVPRSGIKFFTQTLEITKISSSSIRKAPSKKAP
jgi:hypothetical protein